MSVWRGGRGWVSGASLLPSKKVGAQAPLPPPLVCISAKNLTNQVTLIYVEDMQFAECRHGLDNSGNLLYIPLECARIR